VSVQISCADGLQCDVLIIGGGATALVAALEVRKAVDDVAIVCKGRVGRSGNTIVSAAQFWEGVSIVRSEESLQEARLKVRGCRLALGKCSVSTFAHIVELLQIQRMGITAEAIVASALQRTESRGAYYREDYPSSDERRLGSVHVAKAADQLEVNFVTKGTG
jgi:succinate dehydrogenase/fumarate reductase flavoprotein subunit